MFYTCCINPYSEVSEYTMWYDNPQISSRLHDFVALPSPQKPRAVRKNGKWAFVPCIALFELELRPWRLWAPLWVKRCDGKRELRWRRVRVRTWWVPCALPFLARLARICSKRKLRIHKELCLFCLQSTSRTPNRTEPTKVWFSNMPRSTNNGLGDSQMGCHRPGSLKAGNLSVIDTLLRRSFQLQLIVQVYVAVTSFTGFIQFPCFTPWLFVLGPVPVSGKRCNTN